VLNWFAISGVSSKAPEYDTLPVLTEVKHFICVFLTEKGCCNNKKIPGKGRPRLALYAQVIKQEGNFALEMSAEAVQRNKSLCPPISCQRKIVINTLQILLKQFPTYDKITASEC